MNNKRNVSGDSGRYCLDDFQKLQDCQDDLSQSIWAVISSAYKLYYIKGTLNIINLGNTFHSDKSLLDYKYYCQNNNLYINKSVLVTLNYQFNIMRLKKDCRRCVSVKWLFSFNLSGDITFKIPSKMG